MKRARSPMYIVRDLPPGVLTQTSRPQTVTEAGARRRRARVRSRLTSFGSGSHVAAVLADHGAVGDSNDVAAVLRFA
jgi:hypothetical protein